MTADGQRAFANIFPGFVQLIAKGWEAQAAGLEQQQLEELYAIAQKHPAGADAQLFRRRAVQGCC